MNTNDKLLGKTEKSKLRQKVSNETLNATKELLEEKGKAMAIRPTGFGKSYMLARISKSYKKNLYVYPTNVIKNAVIRDYGPDSNNSVKLKNTEFASYSLLNIKRKSGEIREFLSQFDLIMLDEVHMAGASGFVNIYNENKDLFGIEKGKIRLVGVTATPNRSSKTRLESGEEITVDVLNDIFDGYKIFSFTLKDCFELGLMVKPRYAEVVYDIDNFKASIKQRLDKSGIKLAKSNTSEMIKKDNNKLISDLAKMINNIENAPTQIKKIIDDERGKNPSYLKFMTFCRNKKDIALRQEMVSNWFREAYPNHTIRDYIIVTKGSTNGTEFDYEDEIQSVSVLDEIEEEYNTIDLIYCVDMLNMGYHIDNIDGIIMMRNTGSQIVYLQQIGRCMSVTSNKRPIILDFVKNIEMNFFTDHNLGKEDYQKNMAGSQINDAEYEDGVEDSKDLNKKDVYISELGDGTGMMLSKIDAVMNSIENPKERYDEKVRWWYTEMQAPIYVIARLLGLSATDRTIKKIVTILMDANISIEDESKLLLRISATDLAFIKNRNAYNEMINKAVKEIKSGYEDTNTDKYAYA